MKKDPRLPNCVYQKHGAYYLVKRNKWIRLGTEFHEAMAAYGRILAPAGVGMDALIEETLKRAEERCKPNTMKQYRSASVKILKAFVEFHPSQVKPLHVRQFLDHYRSSWPCTPRRR